jgi:hypothetical protein
MIHDLIHDRMESLQYDNDVGARRHSLMIDKYKKAHIPINFMAFGIKHLLDIQKINSQIARSLVGLPTDLPYLLSVRTYARVLDRDSPRTYVSFPLDERANHRSAQRRLQQSVRRRTFTGFKFVPTHISTLPGFIPDLTCRKRTKTNRRMPYTTQTT